MIEGAVYKMNWAGALPYLHAHEKWLNTLVPQDFCDYAKVMEVSSLDDPFEPPWVKLLLVMHDIAQTPRIGRGTWAVMVNCGTAKQVAALAEVAEAALMGVA